MAVDLDDMEVGGFNGLNDEPIEMVLDDSPNVPIEKQLKSDKIEIPQTEDNTFEVELPEDNPIPQGGEGSNSNEPSWKEVVRFGIDKGIFTEINTEGLETMEDSLDAFHGLLQNELQSGIEIAKNDWIEQTLQNPLSKDLVRHLEAGGQIKDFIEVNKVTYSTIDEKALLSDKIMQRNLMFDYYKNTTNWDDTRINKMIARSEDFDELKDESKVALSQLKEFEGQRKEQLKQQLATQRQENEQREEQRIKFINNEIINMKEFLGVPVNAKIKQQIANNVYDNTTFNKINTNLDKYRVVLATLDSLGVLDGNTENISKLYTSNATKTVKKEIANYSFQKGGSVNTAKPNTTKNTDNYLKSVTQQMEKNDPFKFTKLY